MQHLKFLIAASSLVLMAACSQGVNFKNYNPAPEPETASLTPYCVVDMTQMTMSGVVVSFEANGGFSLNFGYGQGGDMNQTPIGGSATIQVSKSAMDLALVGIDPLTRVQLASTEVNENQTRTNIGATINFNELTANPGTYLETPLAAVSRKALETGIKALKKKMDKLPWHGSVIQNIGGHSLLINAGAKAGLMPGDTFEVYNLKHAWKGDACNSTYVGSWREPVEPVAVVEIREVRETSSVGVITSLGQIQPEKGAEVIVKKLVPSTDKTARYLKKKINLGRIKAEAFKVPGGGTFDLEKALNDQIINVLDDSGAFVFDIKQ